MCSSKTCWQIRFLLIISGPAQGTVRSQRPQSKWSKVNTRTNFFKPIGFLAHLDNPSYLTLGPPIHDLCCYPPTKSEGCSFGVIRASIHLFRPSVRPHFLSVLNHISVPIGQFWFILGTNDKYHELWISNKFGQNQPLNTWVIALVLV